MRRRAGKATGHPAFGIVLACGLIFGAAGPAFAQRASPARDAPPHGFYVSLTAFGDIERFSQASSGVMNGQTEGLGIGIGTFVTPRWSLEFEASGRRFIDGEPLIETYGPSAGGINTIIQQRTQSRHRMAGGTVLLAFHPSRRGRFRLAYSAGLSFVRLQRELTFDTIYSEAGATVAASSQLQARTDLVLAPTLQVEASVRLTRRMAFVPYFRAAAFDLDGTYTGAVGTFVFQPGAALRIMVR